MQLKLSGTLKNRAVNFYKEQMTSFGPDYFDFQNMTFTCDGSITSSPFDKNLGIDKIAKKQEHHILRGIENTKKLASSKNFNKALLNKEIDALFAAPRTYAYALFECLYILIKNAKNNSDLESKLKKFQKFRLYVDSIVNISQVELDILVELFLAGASYMREDVKVREEEKFKIYRTEHLSRESIEIISLGKFIAPNRVSVIARDLQSENEMTKYVAPIYFAIRNDAKASQFLNSCASEYCDNPIYVINHARACGVPENLRKMVLERRLY